MADKILYNHAFSISFSVETANDAESVSSSEIRAGILKRLADIRDSELVEAAGMPFDTYEVTLDDALRLHESEKYIIENKFK
jgi:hypothetical protein